MSEAETPLQQAERLKNEQPKAPNESTPLESEGKGLNTSGRAIESVETDKAVEIARKVAQEAIIESRQINPSTSLSQTVPDRPVTSSSKPGLWQRIKTGWGNTSHNMAQRFVQVLRRPPV